jgi:hypothetical protein
MGHWYSKDGEPRHHEGKDGKDTTLREARKLDLYPSVTTIGNIAHKEGLVRWLQEQAAIAAGYMVIGEGLDGLDIDKKFAWRAIAEAKEEVTKAADSGTEIHDKLEKYHDDPFSGSADDQNLCHTVITCIKEHTGLSLFTDFIPEARFCDTYWGYAGMCDLHSKPKVIPWVLDYKTKDEVTDKTRGYEGQAEQLAAYAKGFNLEGARLGNIFISRSAPPEGQPWGVKFYEHKDKNGWSRFVHQLMLWQVTKKYGPYYERYMED